MNPSGSPSQPEHKFAGIMVPVFALRTETDLGIGDTDGVRQMIDWCQRHGLGLLQVLPINETSDDNSPYNAISSLALEPTTIAISPAAIPDLTAARFRKLAPPDLQAELRQGPVNYGRAKTLKRKLLTEAFQNFLGRHWQKQTARAREFRAFLQDNADWLTDYALFRLLMDEQAGWPTWDRWPEDRQNPRRAWMWLVSQPVRARDAATERLLFWMYVQWLAFGQWQALKEYGTRRKVSLMGDIPFGVSHYSADVWANRSLFDLDWNGGAPPEKLFKTDLFTEKWGQNWGIPNYRWDVMRSREFDWWRLRVGNVHKVFHLFRVDHALGFFRIYSFPWRPEENPTYLPLSADEASRRTGGRLPGFKPYPDDSPEHCEFNRQQGEELLHMVCAAAGDTTVVAEDLGVVPAYVPTSLAALHIPGFKIPHFLREPDGSFVAGKNYPRLSVATIATHDHPPLAALWRGLANQAASGDQNAQDEMQRWWRFAGHDDAAPPREFTRQVHETILRAVLKSNSWLAVLMITDVFGQDARFNVPGATAASNWTHRLEQTVAELDRDPDLLAKSRMIERLIKETRRQA